jgi:hypothetical protein
MDILGKTDHSITMSDRLVKGESLTHTSSPALSLDVAGKLGGLESIVVADVVCTVSNDSSSSSNRHGSRKGGSSVIMKQ